MFVTETLHSQPDCERKTSCCKNSHRYTALILTAVWNIQLSVSHLKSSEWHLALHTCCSSGCKMAIHDILLHSIAITSMASLTLICRHAAHELPEGAAERGTCRDSLAQGVHALYVASQQLSLAALLRQPYLDRQCPVFVLQSLPQLPHLHPPGTHHVSDQGHLKPLMMPRWSEQNGPSAKMGQDRAVLTIDIDMI